MNGARTSQLARWAVALAVTAGAIATATSLAGHSGLSRLGHDLPWPEVATGVLLLQAEGAMTALRVRQLAAPVPTFGAALDLTARWVAALTLMPARLGELYGLHAMATRLHQVPGRALNNLFVQRLFDLLVLAVTGLGALLVHGGMPGGVGLGGGLVLLAAGLAFATWRLAEVFASIAMLCRRGRRHPLVRRALRAALQGRRAARATLGGRSAGWLGVSAVVKWSCNLVGTVTLLRALVPDLPFALALGLVVLANLAAVVPVSGLGGVGAPDLTIAGGLVWFGVPAASAAAAALALRVMLLAATLLFSLLVLSGGWLTRVSRPLHHAR